MRKIRVPKLKSKDVPTFHRLTITPQGLSLRGFCVCGFQYGTFPAKHGTEKAETAFNSAHGKHLERVISLNKKV